MNVVVNLLSFQYTISRLKEITVLLQTVLWMFFVSQLGIEEEFDCPCSVMYVPVFYSPLVIEFVVYRLWCCTYYWMVCILFSILHLKLYIISRKITTTNRRLNTIFHISVSTYSNSQTNIPLKRLMQ